MSKTKIFTVVGLAACLLVPVFRPTTAFQNTKAYIQLRKEVKELNGSISNIDNEIASERKKINELRGEGVDAENPKDIYNVVTAIEGVKSIEAQIISINGNNIRAVSEFNPEASNVQADGIQIALKVDDLNNFLTKLNELNIPYETINVIYPENKVVVRFNTKGGLS